MDRGKDECQKPLCSINSADLADLADLADQATLAVQLMLLMQLMFDLPSPSERIVDAHMISPWSRCSCSREEL